MATQDKLVNLADLKVAYDRILSAIAPTYTEGASYTSGNYVIYKGELYRCKAAVTNAAATIDTTNYFTKCTTAGQVETAIKDIAPAYSASSTYTIGKYVSYDRNIYRCKQDIETAGTALPTNTTYWTQVTTGLNDLVDLIKVSGSQPSSAVQNKLWINPNASTEYTVPTYDEFNDLESALSLVVEDQQYIWQTLSKYDNGAWKTPSKSFEVGKKYRIVITPNETFTADVVTVGTSPYAGGVIDTLGSNVSFTNGVAKTFDYSPSAANAIYVRSPSNAAKFSSVVAYEMIATNKAVLFAEDMYLIDADKSRAVKNIDAVRTSKIQELKASLPDKGINYQKTLSGTDIVLDDEQINELSMSTVPGIIYPVNFYKYNQSAVQMSSYNNNFTVTEQNNGFSIAKDTFNTGVRFTKDIPISIPVSGYVYISCDAHTTHPTVPCQISLADKSNTDYPNLAEPAKGNGHLMMGAYVTAGMTVTVKCFAGADDTYANTWYYENIMLSYSPFAKYEPREGIRSNYDVTIMIADYTASAQSISDGSPFTGYRVNFETGIASPDLPASDNEVCAILNTLNFDGLKPVSYNAVFNAQENNLIGISTTGKVSIFRNGDGASVVSEWAKSVNLSIMYTPNSGTYTGSEKNYPFRTGNVIKYNSTSSVSYHTSTHAKRKILCFGDSITGMFDKGNGYVGILDGMNQNCEFVNCGFAGCRWTDHSDSAYQPFSMNRLVDAIVSGSYTTQDASAKVDPSSASYSKLFADHLNNIKNADFTQVDVITILYGLNDYASGVYLNSADDPSASNKQRTNVEDAVKYSISQLLTKYPNLTIILVTPYWSYILNGDSNTTPNSKGKYLVDYCGTIENAGKAYNMPTAYLYYIGVNGLNRDTMMLDGAHPNYRLSKMIANRINQIVGEYQ